MSNQWSNIKQNRPAIFDWLVFIFSISLGFIFPSLARFAHSTAFSGWMLAALLLYVAGSWLKHKPLYYRLAKSGNANQPVRFLLLLIIGHWLIMMMGIIVAESAFRQLIGIPSTTLERVSGYTISASILGGIFITWLVFRPGNKSSKQLTDNKNGIREFVADVLLICGVAMLSFVFWEKSTMEMLANMPVDSIGEVCLVFIFLATCFVLFYLPLRYLYLIDDQFNRVAWKRLLLIFLLIMIRSLFNALQT